jgi:hypothetical protein
MNQNDVNCHLIAKVVFCGSTSSSSSNNDNGNNSNEIRKFCVHDKDYQQFVTLVSDSLCQQQCTDDEFQLMYLDSENDWVTFSSDHEWNEAKQLYRRGGLSSSRVMMKVKVVVRCDNSMKQHCSLNARGKKRRTGSSSSKHSHSAPSSSTRPDRQHLTVGYSFEEFRKQMEAMSQTLATTTTTPATAASDEECKKRKQKKRPSTSSSGRKTSRKARKTESEVPSITSSSCSSSDESFFTMMSDSSVVEAA